MAEIYTRVGATISWSGEGADDSDDAMELILGLGNWTQAHEDRIFGDDDDEYFSGDDSIQTPTDTAEWLGFPLRSQKWPAVWRFLERPYWSRVWIIQEPAVRGNLTKAGGRIFCGQKIMERDQCLLRNWDQQMARYWKSFESNTKFHAARASFNTLGSTNCSISSFVITARFSTLAR